MARLRLSWAAACLAGCGFVPAAVAKDSCLPPVFYTSLPRDRDWYYGVARDSDTEKAREQSIRNLGKQVTGDLESWTQADVDKLAGPGRDRWDVAAHVGRLLPASTLLSGWEQDDFERCDGYSYVLVRIEKERIARFITGNETFRKDLYASFEQRLSKAEKNISALTKRSAEQDCLLAALDRRLDRLSGALGRFPRAARESGFSAPETEGLSRRLNALRDQTRRIGATPALEAMLAGLEGDYGRLLVRMREYQKANEEVVSKRLRAEAARSAPRLKAILAGVDAGKATYADVAAAIGLYQSGKQFGALRDFCDRILSGRDGLKLEGHDDFVAYMGIAADMSLKDEARLLSDGEEFLKNYPGSNMFEAVRVEMEGAMAAGRTAEPASADLSLPPLEADASCAPR
jgi:hypothetical protein